MKTYRHYAPFKVTIAVVISAAIAIAVALINDHYALRDWVRFADGFGLIFLQWWLLSRYSDALLKY